LQIAIDWNIPLAVSGDGGSNLIPLRGGVIIDDSSHVDAVEAMLKKLRAVGDDGNLTLSDCLTAFTAEEVLEEGTWYVPSNIIHNSGIHSDASQFFSFTLFCVCFVNNVGIVMVAKSIKKVK
jgi:hypothetical protein